MVIISDKSQPVLQVWVSSRISDTLAWHQTLQEYSIGGKANVKKGMMHPILIWSLSLVKRLNLFRYILCFTDKWALTFSYFLLQVIHMGWVNERLEGTDSSQLYKFKFLALKGSSFYIFSTPPVKKKKWYYVWVCFFLLSKVVSWDFKNS